VVVSGGGECQLLGVPNKLEKGTGELQAKAVCNLLDEWHLKDMICGYCGDTTNSISGRIHGAGVRIEHWIGRALLYFTCRHHVLELPLGAAFESAMGPSSGPDMQMFLRYRNSWKSIDQSK